VRAFEFLEPHDVREASAMLAAHGEGARPLAGGTSLVLLLRQRLADVTHLVHLGNLASLRGIRVDETGALHIGALATHAEIAAHRAIREHFPVIAEMAAQVANPQIRNIGTLGGNLCYGDPASDPPTCLSALSARARVLRGAEEREIELAGFFKGFYENSLSIGDIVVEIVVPPLGERTRAFYSRFVSTPAEGRPLASVALKLTRSGSRQWERVRLFLGAVVPAPTRAVRAEQVLTGRAVTRDLLAEAAEAAIGDLAPVDDFRASGAYRREVTGVIVRRLLERAFETTL
jgi:carbon-monoxide dehydrogenase medium subunit